MSETIKEAIDKLTVEVEKLRLALSKKRRYATGIYASGEMGLDHARKVLVDLLDDLEERGGDTLGVRYLLAQDPSDDLEEERQAIDILNANAEGGVFEFVDGDLLFTDDPGED